MLTEGEGKKKQANQPSRTPRKAQECEAPGTTKVGVRKEVKNKGIGELGEGRK